MPPWMREVTCSRSGAVAGCECSLTQVYNLRLSKLLSQEESNWPEQVENKLKPIECQGPLLCLNSTLFPHQV